MPRRELAAAVVLLSVMTCAGLVVRGSRNPPALRPPTSASSPTGQPATAEPLTTAASATASARPGSAGSADGARRARVQDLFSRRQAAALARNTAGWLSTVDPASPDYLARQRRAAAVLAQLPLRDWAYELIDDDGTRLTVRLRYRLQTYDRTDLVRTQVWRLSASGQPSSRAPLTVADDTGSDADVWDLGGSAAISVVAGRASLVIGEFADPVLQAYAAEADAASARVTAVWGSDWPRRVVVVAPQRAHDAALLLGLSGETSLAGTAALTTGQLRTSDSAGSGATSGDRVVLSPGTYDRLTEVGKRVVLTHEVTHVATRASTRTFPPGWLAEGFADYVGFLGTDVPLAVAAQDLMAELQAGRVPVRLPPDGAFSPVGKGTSSAYEQAWLACRLIAQRDGQASLVRLYRGVGAGESLDDAFHEALHATPSQFVARWRAYLIALTN